MGDLIERLDNAGPDDANLFELCMDSFGEIERLTNICEYARNELRDTEAENKQLQARVEELEDVRLMASRYLYDPNWDTHRNNLIDALKVAATEQETDDE